MEVIGSGIFSAQTKLWKTKVNKGNKLTKRILNVNGMKKEQQWHEKLPTLANTRTEVCQLFWQKSHSAYIDRTEALSRTQSEYKPRAFSLQYSIIPLLWAYLAHWREFRFDKKNSSKWVETLTEVHGL